MAMEATTPTGRHGQGGRTGTTTNNMGGEVERVVLEAVLTIEAAMEVAINNPMGVTNKGIGVAIIRSVGALALLETEATISTTTTTIIHIEAVAVEVAIVLTHLDPKRRPNKWQNPLLMVTAVNLYLKLRQIRRQMPKIKITKRNIARGGSHLMRWAALTTENRVHSDHQQPLSSKS